LQQLLTENSLLTNFIAAGEYYQRWVSLALYTNLLALHFYINILIEPEPFETQISTTNKSIIIKRIFLNGERSPDGMQLNQGYAR